MDSEPKQASKPSISASQAPPSPSSIHVSSSSTIRLNQSPYAKRQNPQKQNANPKNISSSSPTAKPTPPPSSTPKSTTNLANANPNKNHVSKGNFAPPENTDYTEKERKDSKNASLKDGSFWAVMYGAGEEYVSPFAIRLGAGSEFSGIIQTVPLFFGSLAQLIALPLEQKIKNRKLTLAIIIFMQALVWILFALIALMANPSQDSNLVPLTSIFILFCLYQFFGQLANPMWSSWMAELVSPNERGEYFAHRSTLIVLVQLISILGAGWLLSNISLPIFQLFAFLFIVAFLARSVSTYYLSSMTDKFKQNTDSFGASPFADWKEFLTSPANAEARRFTLYVLALTGSVYIASPFFDIYMLKILKFDYFTWSILTTASTFVKFLTFGYWGKINDRFGNRAVLFGTGFLIPGVALLWTFSSDVSWLFIAQIFSGAVWSGFELACFNYVISAHERSARTAQAAAYNFARGTGALLGTIVGALFLFSWSFFGPVGAGAFVALFFFSSIARYISSFYFLPRFSSKTFEGGMDGRKFLWQVVAVQPTNQLGGYLAGVSDAGMRLATIGVEKTRGVARQLRESAGRRRR